MNSDRLAGQRIEVTRIGSDYALYSRSCGAIVLTNAFGKSLFDILRTNVDPGTAAARIAVDYDMPPEDAAAAVREIVAQWREAGLYKHAYDAHRDPVDYRAPVDPHLRTYHHADRSLTIACEDRQLFDQLVAVMAPLDQDAADDGIERIEIFCDAAGYGLFLDKRPLWGRAVLDECRHLVIREVLECLCKREDAGASLHASAVGLDGQAIVFAGESGAGKTTLGLGLAAAGCTYIGDDHVILHRDGRSVFATPLRASAKVWSWELDEVKAHLDPGDGHLPRSGVRYARPAEAAVPGTTHAVKAMIFPKYAADAGNHIARISPSEGLQRLVTAGARTTRSVDSLVPLVTLLNTTPCYALNFNTSGFSVSTCRELLTGALP